jgi:hypothetical protein
MKHVNLFTFIQVRHLNLILVAVDSYSLNWVLAALTCIGGIIFVKGLPCVQIASGEPDVPEDFHQQVSGGAPGPSRHSHPQKGNRGTPVTHFSVLFLTLFSPSRNFLVYLRSKFENSEPIKVFLLKLGL